MKKINLLALTVIIACLSLSSCKDDDNVDTKPVGKSKSKKITLTTTATENQDDPSLQKGVFTKISFKEGKVVDGDNWDIAVRGRLFLINGSKKKGETLNFDNELKRTKDVSVASMVGNYEEFKSAEKLVNFSYHQDVDYAQGSQSLTTAINYASNTRSNSQTRQAWHVRSYNDVNKIILTPVIFVFKTHDDHFVKMAIRKVERTNNDFDEKEDVNYTIEYYYNPKEGSPKLDDSI